MPDQESPPPPPAPPDGPAGAEPAAEPTAPSTPPPRRTMAMPTVAPPLPADLGQPPNRTRTQPMVTAVGGRATATMPTVIAGPPAPPATSGDEGDEGIVVEEVPEGETGPTAIEEAMAALLREKWSDVVALYEREIALETDKRRRAVLEHEVGELEEARGSDEGAAVKSYGRAFTSDPTLKPNLWAIRRICQRRGLWPNLLKLVDAEVRLAQSAAERAGLLVEKGQLLEDRLRDPQGAKRAFEQAAQENPTSLPALMALEKIAVREGDAAALEKLYRQLAAATAEPARKVVLLIDLARLYDEQRAGEALAALKDALALGAEAERVLDEMERVAERAGRGEDLIAALEARVALTEARGGELQAEAVAALRRRQARIARAEPIKDGVRAWGYLEKALQRLPGEPLLLGDLAELAEELGRWADLADVLAQRVARLAAPPPGLQLELASALRRAGRDAQAEAVEGVLERGAPLPLLFARERRALKAADGAQLAALYRREADVARGANDPAWAAQALTAAGAAFERGGDAVLAIAAWREAREADPAHRPAFDALDRMLERTKRHAERDALLTQELKGAQGARAEQLMEALVELKLDRLGDVEGGLAVADALCAAKGGAVPYRARMVELTRSARKWADAADHLGKLAEALAAAGATERADEAQLDRGWILERHLGKPDEAQAIYDQVARSSPRDERAAGELGRILRAQGRHGELAALLRREIDGTLRPERASGLMVELADLLERRLGRPDEAAEVWRALLDRSPGNAPALRALRGIHRRGREPKRLAETIEAGLEARRDGDAKAADLLALGDAWEQGGQIEHAEEAYARALAAATDAGGPPGLSPHAALGRVAQLARRRDLAQLDGALAALVPFADPPAAAALAEERAWLAFAAGDLEGAGERLAPALGEAPSLPALLARVRLAARRGEAGALAEALAALAGAVDDPTLGGALELRAALLAAAAGNLARPLLDRALARGAPPVELSIAASDLVDEPEPMAARIALTEGAVQLEWRLERAHSLEARGELAEAAREVQAALAIAPQHLGALSAAQRIAKAGGDRGGYARALAHIAAALAQTDAAAARFAEAGRLFDELGSAPEAQSAWREVLARRPGDDEAYQRAHALAHAAGDTGGLEELLGARLLEVKDAPERIALLLERGELRATHRRRHAALDDYRAALEADPQHAESLRRLGMLQADLGMRPEAVRTLDAFTEVATEPGQLRAAYLRLAELNRALAEPHEAVRSLQRVLEISPDDADAMERLVALQLAVGESGAAAQQLRQRARLAPDGPERAKVELRVAQLYQDSVGDGRSAREALARALEHEPLNLAALERIVPLCATQGELQLQRSVLERAAHEARAALEARPEEAGAYLALSKVLGWQSDEDSRLLAAQAAALAGGQVPPPREGAGEPTREISAAGWERLQPAGARGVALEVWHEAAAAAGKLLGGDPAALGVGKGERQNAKGIPLAWIPVDKIARALGVKEYELYVHGERERARAGVNALALGASHMERLTPLTRARVARRAALLRDRAGVLETVDPAQLELFFAACARSVQTRWSGKVRHDDTLVEDWARSVAKTLDRKAKKGLTALAPRFAELGDLQEWRRELLLGSARAALAVSGDLAATLADLGTDLRSALGQHLARFAASIDLPIVRRELGLRT